MSEQRFENEGVGGDEGKKRESPTEGMTTRQKVLHIVKSNMLVLLLIIAMILGIVLGIACREVDPPFTKRQQMYLKFPGEILMNMLKLLILPLIVTSLISGMTSLDSKSSGKIGGSAVVYYLTTTLLAVIEGIILVLLIEPGSRSSAERKKTNEIKAEAADTFLDLIRQMFPSNIIEACFSKRITRLKPREVNLTAEEIVASSSNATTKIEYDPLLETTNGINMLGLVVFSIALGIAINKLGSKGEALKNVIESFCDATMIIVGAVIWYSPIGVLFLIASQIVAMDDVGEMFEQLGLYFVTVMAGLAVHGFIVLPLLYLCIVRKNPYRFIRGILQAMMTALGTSSSSATLPITMKNLRENNGVDQRVISFVAPVGATINMDGTALYEAVAVIFIGQIRNLDMGIGNVITICVTATAAAIGAAGVPQAGLVTMVLVLTAVGFPTEDVGLILAVDWLLDRFRTMVNVMGDGFGAGIVEKIASSDLKKYEETSNYPMITDDKDNNLIERNGKLNSDVGKDNKVFEGDNGELNTSM